MEGTQIISATEARKNFFDLLNTVYYGKRMVVVQKNKAPWVTISPFSELKKLFDLHQVFTSKDSLFYLIGLGRSKTRSSFSSDKYKLFPRL